MVSLLQIPIPSVLFIINGWPLNLSVQVLSNLSTWSLPPPPRYHLPTISLWGTIKNYGQGCHFFFKIILPDFSRFSRLIFQCFQIDFVKFWVQNFPLSKNKRKKNFSPCKNCNKIRDIVRQNKQNIPFWVIFQNFPVFSTKFPDFYSIAKFPLSHFSSLWGGRSYDGDKIMVKENRTKLKRREIDIMLKKIIIHKISDWCF